MARDVYARKPGGNAPNCAAANGRSRHIIGIMNHTCIVILVLITVCFNLCSVNKLHCYSRSQQGSLKSNKYSIYVFLTAISEYFVLESLNNNNDNKITCIQ